MANGQSMSTLTRSKLHILLIIALLALFVRCSSHHAYTPPSIPVETFQVADIVFRLGRTLQSEAIASKGPGGYSHIGMMVEIDSIKHIIHIEPNRQGSERIKVESVADFFNPEVAVAGCVMRYNSLTDSMQQILSSYAKSILAQGVSFDHDYQLSDSSRMYCTELVENIFNKVDIDLSQGERIRLPLAKEPVILPSAIYQNDSLCDIWSYRTK